MRYFDTRLDMLRYLLPPKAVIAEIGVHQGIFAQQLFCLMPQLLVLIDPFEGIVPSGNQDGNNVVYADLDKVYQHLSTTIGPLNNIRLHRGYSQDILPMYPPIFDCVYIDGDHSYEGVKRDLEIAWAKTKPGGYICGHDYEMNNTKTARVYDFGVKKAVDEFCGTHQVFICAKGLDGCVSYAIRKPYSTEIGGGGRPPTSSSSEKDHPPAHPPS